MTMGARIWWAGPLVPALREAWLDGLLLHAERRTAGAAHLADGQGRQRVVLVDDRPGERTGHAGVAPTDTDLWLLERDGTWDTDPVAQATGVILWGRPRERRLPLAAQLRERGLAVGVRLDLVLGATAEAADARADRFSEQYAADEAAARAMLGALSSSQPVAAARGIPRGSYLVGCGRAWIGPGSPGIPGGQWTYTLKGTPEDVAEELGELLRDGVSVCYLGGSTVEAELLPEVLVRSGLR